MTDIHGDTEYKSTITEITVHDASRNPLTHFEATVIRLADDGGGAYITITQGENEIRLDCNELPLMNEAIDRLMMQHKTKDAQSQEQSDNEHVLVIGQKWRRGDGKEVEVFWLSSLIEWDRIPRRLGTLGGICQMANAMVFPIEKILPLLNCYSHDHPSKAHRASHQRRGGFSCGKALDPTAANLALCFNGAVAMEEDGSPLQDCPYHLLQTHVY